ncbi:hypothetical protein ACFL3E_00945 [Patescibacteria group bacterium]
MDCVKGLIVVLFTAICVSGCAPHMHNKPALPEGYKDWPFHIKVHCKLYDNKIITITVYYKLDDIEQTETAVQIDRLDGKIFAYIVQNTIARNGIGYMIGIMSLKVSDQWGVLKFTTDEGIDKTLSEYRDHVGELLGRIYTERERIDCIERLEYEILMMKIQSA